MDKDKGLGREITAMELARILRFGGSREAKRKKAVRWMKRTCTGLQHVANGYWFTTIRKLMECATAEHAFQEALRRGFRVE